MALSFIGHAAVSDGNARYTNGSAPAANSVHTSTVDGDLLVWFVYIRGTGGNESFAWPSGWTEVFQSASTSGCLGVAWRFRQAGDTTYTLGTLTNVTSGTTGETVATSIMTFRGANTTTPIGSYTASLSTWATSATALGPISPPSDTSLPAGDYVVVIGFRQENVTSASALTGDNLTWQLVQSGGVNYFDTTSGADCGGSVQIGKNLSGSTQTMTSKTITTTGTTQVGCGRMFVVKEAPPASLIHSRLRHALPTAILTR